MLPVAFRLSSAPLPHIIVSAAPNLPNDETPRTRASNCAFSLNGFRVPRVHQVIAKLDEGELFAEWCQQRRLVGLRSYDDSFVVADDHRPVLEPWATPRGLGSGSSLVDGIEVADQNVAVLRAPLPEVIGNDSKLPSRSLLVDEFRHTDRKSTRLNSS